MSEPVNSTGLVGKHPIRVTVNHCGKQLMDQVFQHTPVSLGRLTENDVVLPFDFVSRFHCELRYLKHMWTAVDLGSTNGLMKNTTERFKEIPLNDGVNFRIQELDIRIKFEKAEELPQGFQALHDATTIIGNDDDLRPKSAAPAKEQISLSISTTDGDTGHIPLLDVNAARIFLCPHPLVASGAVLMKTSALQMLVFWHDQLLEAKEIPLGTRVHWENAGELWDLGGVRSDRTHIKIPKGCSPINIEAQGQKNLVVLPDTPVAFRTDSNVTVSFRYVPRSPELPGQVNLVEEKLINPLLMSSAIHGTVAIAAMTMATRHHGPSTPETERFATIIMAPTPPPLALQPTPTPLPLPTPPEIAKVEEKKEPPKKLEPPKFKKVTIRKMKKPVLAKRDESRIVAKEEEPPVKLDAKQLEPPVPAPTSVFEAKKVGALKMLSMLNAGPASNVANIEKIQISRVPTGAEGSVIGREEINGTGSIESNLSQSARGGSTGKGDGVAGIAVGGKNAGDYKMAGLSGKTGKRKVMGTVIGGATYSGFNNTEGLTRDQVMKIVQQNQSQIQTCYERSLLDNPDLAGRAEFEWEITSKGDVTLVKIKEATIKNGESLLDCVKGVFSRMKFPAAKNGESTTPTISLPFGRL